MEQTLVDEEDTVVGPIRQMSIDWTQAVENVGNSEGLLVHWLHTNAENL